MPRFYLFQLLRLLILLINQDQWLDILPRFKKLQVFRGDGLWVSVKHDLESMHHLINNLAFMCPSLRELDHEVHYDKYNAYKRILISRQGEEGEVISYQVTKPRHRYGSLPKGPGEVLT